MPEPTTWIIGRSESCDIVVSQDAVTSRHCSLTHDGQQWILEDLGSSNGTFVDGYRLVPRQPVIVTTQNRITLGQVTPMPWPTQAPRRLAALPSDNLTIRTSEQPRNTGAFRTIRIGRGPENDVVIDYPMISWEHAVIIDQIGQLVVEDLNSRNGVAVNRIENRVKSAIIQPGDDLYLGSYKLPVSRVQGARKTKVGEAAKQQVNFAGQQLLIGRDPACDQPLDYPMISWHHAKLTRTATGIFVEDLGSRNGTFVNGTRITTRVRVNPGDQIGLGSFRFQLQDGGGLVRREYYGNVTIEARGVSVIVPGKRLIEPVTFTIYPSELVALMGPAGSGKTTLLKALNGYTHPSEGQVLFNGQDLYRSYDLFRLQMGYVPQDDIVHPQLTVREALYYSVKLRTDLSDAEIDIRINKVLADLGILDKKDTVIGSPEKKVLSGGQRKRVNIALELIHDTPVLFLDEPTSGLSSYDAEGVIRLLKRLSLEGKTIITTIHQPSLDMFKEFDDLIMMSRDAGGSGAMAFFGPAYPDSINFFNRRPAQEAAMAPAKELSPEMLLSGLATQPTANWLAAYAASPYRKQFVEDRAGTQAAPQGAQKNDRASRPFDLRQWIALTRRTLICKIRDKEQTRILLLQAPLFALLIVAVTASRSFESLDLPDLTKKLTILNFLMVVAAIWFGCNNAARDIVGEWTVYQRERMVALKLPSYVFSKLTILLAITSFQCVALLGIVWFGCGLHGTIVNFAWQLLILLLAGMIGASIGLCISASAKSTESAIALLPVVLLPVIALGGGLQPTYTVAKPVQWLTYVIPSRWAFEANLSDEGGKKPDGSLMWPDKGDAAGQAIPRGNPAPVPEFVKDKVDDQTPARAAEASEVIEGDPHSAYRFRQKGWTYFSILAIMLAASIAAALGFLRRRDIL
jgi:ABC-type multidrug transport system ATPase subunit/pSer/pThr/pTyr-binding forkhead associated (FHA) protein/ABC-type multidrug transport system permease subunit